jgi:uncharacterized membrane protein
MSQTRIGRALAAKADPWDLLYISLNPLPAFLVAAVLLSDTICWATGSALFFRAAEWLLGAVLVTGMLAAADGLFLYISLGRMRPSKACLLHTVGNLLALLLSLSSLILRFNDGAAALVPAGIGLSVASLVLLLATGRLARGMALERGPEDSGRFDW